MIKLTRDTDPNTSRINQLRLKTQLSNQEKIEMNKLKVQRASRLATNKSAMKGTTDLISTTMLQARKMSAMNKVKNKSLEKEKEKEQANLDRIENARLAAQEAREARDRKIRKERAKEHARFQNSKQEHSKDLNNVNKQ